MSASCEMFKLILRIGHCCGQVKAKEPTIDDYSTLVQVQAWGHQAKSHYQSHYWPRSMAPYIWCHYWGHTACPPPVDPSTCMHAMGLKRLAPWRFVVTGELYRGLLYFHGVTISQIAAIYVRLSNGRYSHYEDKVVSWLSYYRNSYIIIWEWRHRLWNCPFTFFWCVEAYIIQIKCVQQNLCLVSYEYCIVV